MYLISPLEAIHIKNPAETADYCEYLFDKFGFNSEFCLSPSEAVRRIRCCEISNRFSSKLKEFYSGDDLKQKIVSVLAEKDESVNIRSLEKKVGNWINGNSIPAEREDVFAAAFALGLDEEQTSELLGICDDSCIHYRNGRELTYAFCLRLGYTYTEAVDFYSGLPCPENVISPTQEPKSFYTNRFISTFAVNENTDLFIEKYKSHLTEMGNMHNNAYKYFDRFFSVLVKPDGESDRYSIEQVAEMFLSSHSGVGKNRKSLDEIQKVIRKSWPSTTELKNIRMRRTDVSRKLLLLLYVATENLFADDVDDFYDDRMTSDEQFENHWWDINLMLMDCGMPALNPDNPFDWIITYALHINNEDESMYDRLCSVMDILYMNSDENSL